MYYNDSLFREKRKKTISVHHCFEYGVHDILLVVRCDVTSRLVGIEKVAFVQVIKQSANISGKGKARRVRAREKEPQLSDVDRLAQIQ